jgi:hypothetical protein
MHGYSLTLKPSYKKFFFFTLQQPEAGFQHKDHFLKNLRTFFNLKKIKDIELRNEHHLGNY